MKIKFDSNQQYQRDAMDAVLGLFDGQAARPIVVMDEPQNMETPTAREAVASLNPLCTLRYSATHRNQYNLVYKLDPVQAYDLKLVKRIEVSSVLDEAKDYSAINVPDMLGYLQAKTELTRKTIAGILMRSGRLNEVQKNPQQFLEQAQQAIGAELHNLVIAGIKYERINGQEYEMMLFEAEEITGALTSMIEVDNSIYDAVPFESEVERAFAEAMGKREDIKLFIKLPGWFKIETPIGTYNPDWAIVKQDDAKVYLVRETKSTRDQLKLRGSEWAKIQCGKAHFDTLQVDFAHLVSASEV